ncbi:MAG TPA: hypothetical protein PK924_07370 [Bacilli bacterium]|nr:hypothetical protein [Bacilli bacterium]
MTKVTSVRGTFKSKLGERSTLLSTNTFSYCINTFPSLVFVDTPTSA